jgi:hypothetical protein
LAELAVQVVALPRVVQCLLGVAGGGDVLVGLGLRDRHELRAGLRHLRDLRPDERTDAVVDDHLAAVVQRDGEDLVAVPARPLLAGVEREVQVRVALEAPTNAAACGDEVVEILDGAVDGTSVLRLRVAHGPDESEVALHPLALLEFLRARGLRGVNGLHHVGALDGGEEPGAFLLVHHLEMARSSAIALRSTSSATTRPTTTSARIALVTVR